MYVCNACSYTFFSLPCPQLTTVRSDLWSHVSPRIHIIVFFLLLYAFIIIMMVKIKIKPACSSPLVKKIYGIISAVLIEVLAMFSYHLENSITSEVPHTKYLGVTIDQKLSWNEHIQRVTSKANQVNGFLHRNLRQCPVSVKNNCYKMIVRPIVEYASSVWAPHTHTNINQLESIQRRAARFCYNNFSRFSSVTRMMSSLNLPATPRLSIYCGGINCL